MKFKYFGVKAKCGHVGKGKYIEIEFAIKAISKKDAAKITRNYPRVKRDDKYAIISVKELSYKEYKILKKDNDNNPYLKCKNKQEQNKNCKDIKLYVKNLYEQKVYDKEARKERIKYIIKKNKIIENSFQKFYLNQGISIY